MLGTYGGDTTKHPAVCRSLERPAPGGSGSPGLALLLGVEAESHGPVVDLPVVFVDGTEAQILPGNVFASFQVESVQLLQPTNSGEQLSMFATFCGEDIGYTQQTGIRMEGGGVTQQISMSAGNNQYGCFSKFRNPSGNWFACWFSHQPNGGLC